MKKFGLVLLLVLGLVAVASAAPFQNLVQGIFFSDVGGNNANAGIVYTRVSDSETLQFQFTTSDTVAHSMDNSAFTVGAGNTFALEGSTDDTFESILSSADVTADVTYTLRDISSGVLTVGAFTHTYCTGPLVTASVDTIVFLADRAYTITDIDYIHQVKESAGTLTVMPERLQGTEAVAAGNDLVTTAFDATSIVANTTTTGALTSTTAFLTLAAGDRIGLDFTDDTAGELANVCVTFGLVPD